ncbi:hypothetical protein ElyMa_005336300 [Elysia marginata]|uniref:Uncharacterized protein n=1 Tax=Elysia marginata TaxID=1093978 RepID=A0AAV4E8V2_9GAST|nr:hypothetical protein ElyMa_005336300 [Elysia marginata]
MVQQIQTGVLNHGVVLRSARRCWKVLCGALWCGIVRFVVVAAAATLLVTVVIVVIVVVVVVVVVVVIVVVIVIVVAAAAALAVAVVTIVIVRGGVVSASNSRSGGRGFDFRPCHVAIAVGKHFTLTFPSPPTCKMGTQLQASNVRYWSAGALVALLCGDTVTLSNEDKFPERD